VVACRFCYVQRVCSVLHWDMVPWRMPQTARFMSCLDQARQARPLAIQLPWWVVCDIPTYLAVTRPVSPLDGLMDGQIHASSYPFFAAR